MFKNLKKRMGQYFFIKKKENLFSKIFKYKDSQILYVQFLDGSHENLNIPY